MEQMMNNIQRHRQAVRDNIMKSFGADDSLVELEVFKGEENDIEKAKWSVGDTKVYQGITWEVGGFNAKGTPLWRKKKDQSGGGSASGSSASQASVSQSNQQTPSTPTSTQGGESTAIKVLKKKIADYEDRIKVREREYNHWTKERSLATDSFLIRKYMKYQNISHAALRKLQQGLRKQENKLIELKKNLQNKTGGATSQLTDPGSDNYKTASEKTGRKNPGRNSYGWKNSAAGYDARELDNE